MWGVERFDADAVAIRTVIITGPLEQWAVSRELRHRLKRTFDDAGIEIPFPQRTLWLRRTTRNRAPKVIGPAEIVIRSRLGREMFADSGGHPRISGRLGQEPSWPTRGAGVGDPGTIDGPPAERTRMLHPVPPPVQAGKSDSAKLADELAAALRAIRGYVPHRVWWEEAGPAHALLAYQALHAT